MKLHYKTVLSAWGQAKFESSFMLAVISDAGKSFLVCRSVIMRRGSQNVPEFEIRHSECCGILFDAAKCVFRYVQGYEAGENFLG